MPRMQDTRESKKTTLTTQRNVILSLAPKGFIYHLYNTNNFNHIISKVAILISADNKACFYMFNKQSFNFIILP